MFKFEAILKYANFPDLDRPTPPHARDMMESLQNHYTGVKMICEWLERRGVEEVLEITVLDRLLRPHTDDDVAYCINGRGVRVLKWRKLDLYLGKLNDKHHLRELHLYSSGNRCLHEHWYRELPKFSNVGLFCVSGT